MRGLAKGPRNWSRRGLALSSQTNAAPGKIRGMENAHASATEQIESKCVCAHVHQTSFRELPIHDPSSETNETYATRVSRLRNSLASSLSMKIFSTGLTSHILASAGKFVGQIGLPDCYKPHPCAPLCSAKHGAKCGRMMYLPAADAKICNGLFPKL